MIYRIRSILEGFKKRSGYAILLATFIGRILSFIASLIALQLIDNTELGYVIYAFTIISFVIPVSGLGLHQGLIRYGALLKTDDEKNSLFIYVLKRGIQGSFILGILIILGSFILRSYILESEFYLIIFSLLIPFSFLLEIIKVQLRLKHQNKQYAIVEITYTVILVIAVFLLSYFYKEIGYVIAIIITPLITSILFFNKLNIKFNAYQKLSIIDISFWKYGFYSSLSNVATQFLSAVDILLIGYLLKEAEMVTIYKYISLIPLSLLFLPRVLLTTDFVALTERVNDKNYIVNYIKNYLTLFSILSTFIAICSLVLYRPLLLLFGMEFTTYSNTFIALVFGVLGVLMLRGLFGNLLSVIGKASINYWIAILAIFINVILNFYLIPKYGIFGAAITSAVLMWFTGIVSCVWFFFFYRKF